MTTDRNEVATLSSASAQEDELQQTDIDGESSGDKPLSHADVVHNLKVLIGIDCIWTFGAAEMMLAASPLYVYLNASNTLIGLIGSTQVLALLGVILSPFITRRFPVKKVYLLLVHIPYLLPWGLIGAGLILSRAFGLSNSWLLTYIIVMNCISGFFAGFVTLPHQEYIAACVPMSHRGRLAGYSNGIGSVLALVSNSVAGWILYTMAKPGAFGWLYVMTWIICQSGYILALFGRERRTPVEKSPKPWSKAMIGAALADKAYMRVIGLYSVYVMIALPLVWTFVSVYGFKDLKMIAAAAATIGIIQKLATIGTSTLIGHFVDKFSAKRVLMYLPLTIVAMLLPVILWRSQYAVYLSAAFGVLLSVGFQATFNTLIYGVPSPENRAGHYTFQILAFYLAVGIGGWLVGAVFDAMSFRPAFILFSVVALALIPITRWVLAPLSDRAQDYS